MFKLILPGWPWYALKTIFNVNVEIIDAKNILHVSPWFQKLAPSSKLNNTPPFNNHLYFSKYKYNIIL